MSTGGRPILRDVTHAEPESARLAAARVIAIPPAAGAEGKLMRALQEAVTAYSGALPTPRERESIRKRLHGAVDVYFTDKLAEASTEQPARPKKGGPQDGNDEKR